jgi:hypothetical protein
MQTIINTKADLDALKGTPDYVTALIGLAGAAQTYVNKAAPGQMTDWVLEPNTAILTAFGYSQDKLNAELTSLGVTPVTSAKPVDYITSVPADDKTTVPQDKFYDVVLDPATSTYVKTPKDLVALKADWKSQINATAGTLLASSDWMVVRKVESNIDIPAAWSTYRTDVRAYANKVQADIAAVTTVEALIPLVMGLTWPVTSA